MGLAICGGGIKAQGNEDEKPTQKMPTKSRVAASTLSKGSMFSKLSQNDQILASLLNIIADKLNMISIPNMALVFRASEHKFKALKFHEQCHGKTNTILIAHTTGDIYFGGFTPCEWKKDQMLTYEEDIKSQSFLFRVDKNQLITYDIKAENNSKYAIMNDNECGPVFGQGHDINIVDEADKKQSWNNLAKSYKCDYPFGSYKANTQLTGEEKYKLKDYQIWQLKMQ